jgi:hypothetical protein
MRLWYFSHDESAVKRVPIAVYVNTHSKVAIGTTALGQGLANVVHEVLLAAGRGADGLLLEFDLRHDGRSRVAQLAQWTGGVIRSGSRRGGLRCAGRWQGGERGCVVAPRHLQQHWAFTRFRATKHVLRQAPQRTAVFTSINATLS